MWSRRFLIFLHTDNRVEVKIHFSRFPPTSGNILMFQRIVTYIYPELVIVMLNFISNILIKQAFKFKVPQPSVRNQQAATMGIIIINTIPHSIYIAGTNLLERTISHINLTTVPASKQNELMLSAYTTLCFSFPDKLPR